MESIGKEFGWNVSAPIGALGPTGCKSFAVVRFCLMHGSYVVTTE